MAKAKSDKFLPFVNTCNAILGNLSFITVVTSIYFSFINVGSPPVKHKYLGISFTNPKIIFANS